jgi:hypothetical protein
VAARDHAHDHPDAPVVDAFVGELAVAYALGPPYGDRFVSWRDLDQGGQARRALRRQAAHNLDARLNLLRVHGQPPALMLGFEGLASSLLLAETLWPRFEAAVPGELVVGVPARDVVIVTGSQSPPGLAKARRAVDRVFFAGDRNLLTRDLLVRRRGVWAVYRPGAPEPPSAAPPQEPTAPVRSPMRRQPWPGQRAYSMRGPVPDELAPHAPYATRARRER